MCMYAYLYMCIYAYVDYVGAYYMHMFVERVYSKSISIGLGAAGCN